MSHSDADPTVLHFATCARAYCELIEHPERDPVRLARALSIALARLYAAGLDLPDADPDPSIVFARAQAPENHVIRTAFRGREFYGEVFAVYGDAALDTACLPDDLAEIYRDIASPLGAFEKGDRDGRVAGTAVWEWRLAIEGHSGRHITCALRALFAILSESAETP